MWIKLSRLSFGMSEFYHKKRLSRNISSECRPLAQSISNSRPAEYGLARFVVKRYAEQVLSSSNRWKRLSSHFPRMSPSIRAYTMTSYEIQLMQWILGYHLGNNLHLRVTESDDQLIEYEELIDFISRAQELSNKMSSINHHAQLINGSIPTIPIVPSSAEKPPPSVSILSDITQKSMPLTNNCHTSMQSTQSLIHSQKPKEIENGWVQINNAFVPFIVKNDQRLVPYLILAACQILQSNELLSFVTPATSSEIALLQSMVDDRKINNGKIPENCSLINIRHILIGAKNLIYMKLLPKDNPASKINHQYQSVLALRGGFLNIAIRPVPFVCSNDQCYVSLSDILAIYPELTMQLKHLARAPRTDQFDYLQLVRMYSNGNELSSDTVLISMGELSQRQINPLKSLTLIDYRARQKAKLEADMIPLKKSSTTK